MSGGKRVPGDLRRGTGKAIACLAWGSLLWKPGRMRLASPWAVGGSCLPIEFCRVADGGELSTAVLSGANQVPTRWALLDASDLIDAAEQLREREGIDPANLSSIGSWSASAVAVLQQAAPFANEIGNWAKRQGLGGVVWTALQPRFDGENGRAPTLAEAVSYLKTLTGPTRQHAEQYVRRVAPEIRTPFRSAFECLLGWNALREA